MVISTYISIVTLNFSKQQALIKTIGWQIDYLKKKKLRTCNMLPTRDSFQHVRQTQTKWIEKIFHAYGNNKK